MRRPLVLFLMVAASFALLAGKASAEQVKDSYCSPTGDYCTVILQERGRIKFEIVTTSFRGSYGLCIKPPQKPRECRSFNLVRTKGAWGSKIDFARSFSNSRSGGYAVSWHYEGSRIGKTLHFSKG